VTEVVGLNCAAMLSQVKSIAGWHDPLGLASRIMHGCGQRCILSRAAVHHFESISYEEPTAHRLAECERRLARYRG
jgi:hypothetical protein